MMVADHINYLTFEDPGAVHTVRRALKLAEAGDLYGAAETAGVDVSHAATVSQGLRRGMRFSIGAELDNDPRARPDAQNIVDAMRPDGMIRSVHFLTIEHPEKGPDFQWPFDNPEFMELFDVVGTERTWQLYITKLLDDIEKLPGHIVGHFYVPATFGHWPQRATLEEYENRLLDACAARGMAIEINTRLLYRDRPPELKAQYREALVRLMKKAKAKGVGIAVASDAHSPKDQGNSFDDVLAMLDQAGINELVFPVSGRLARVALRATKEHLQKVKSREPAPPPGSSISGFSRAELGLPEREEAEERELLAAGGSKTGHDQGPRRRASGSARVTKKPARTQPAQRPARVQSEPTSVEDRASKRKDQKPAAKPRIEARPAPASKLKPAAKAKAATKPASRAKAKAAAARKPSKVKAGAKKGATAKPKPSGARVKRRLSKAAPAKKVTAKKAPAKRPARKTATSKVKKSLPKRKGSSTKRSTKKTSSKRR